MTGLVATHADSDARPRTYLGVLLLAALGLRLAWAILQINDPHTLDRLPDQREYQQIAIQLLHGGGLSYVDDRFNERVYAVRLPGYPLFIASLGANLPAVRIAQAIIDTATVLAAYLLARRWLAHWPALFAAALVALNPLLVAFSGLILSETLFIAMLAWAMVLLTRQGTTLDRYVAGLTWVCGLALLALSILVRPSAIGLPVVLGVGSVFANPVAHAAYHRRWPLPVGATAALFTALIVLLWGYRNYRALDSWVWTTTNAGFALYDGFHPDADGSSDQRFVEMLPQLQEMDEVTRSQYLASRAREFVREHPRQAVQLIGRKIIRMWSSMPLSEQFGNRLYITVGLLYGVPLFALVLAGLLAGGLARPVKLFLLLPAVYLTGIHTLAVGSMRYRIPAEVPMSVIAASVLVREKGRGFRDSVVEAERGR